MSTKVAVGKFILYQPTRQVFAISSGSWTGSPARKTRPCLVVGYTTAGNPVVAPLLGARKDPKSGLWVPRSNMITDHWSPIRLKHRPTINVPHNSSTLSGTAVEVEDNTSIMTPIIPLKPCYIWMADEGEEIPPEIQPTLVVHDALGYVDKTILNHMRQVMKQIEAANRGPQQGSGIKLVDLS